VLRLVLAVAVVALAAGVAALVRRRRRSDPPTQAAYQLPSQLDRADFERPDAPYLVAVFTSATCSTCADVKAKAMVLESPHVAVQVVPYQERRDLHERYRIEAVPGVVVAGPDGAVQASFLGPISATDLWAAVADVREPGSVAADGGTCEHGATGAG
jgi:hypothetical protein